MHRTTSHENIILRFIRNNYKNFSLCVEFYFKNIFIYVNYYRMKTKTYEQLSLCAENIRLKYNFFEGSIDNMKSYENNSIVSFNFQ